MIGEAFKQLFVSKPFKTAIVKVLVPVEAGLVEAVSVSDVHATVGHCILSQLSYLTNMGYHVRINTPRITFQVDQMPHR